MNSTIEIDRDRVMALRVGDVVEAGFFPTIEDVYRIDASERQRWFVIQSNPKCEDRAADRIGRVGAETYTPKQTLWGKRDRRTRKMPRLIRNLLPGYLFALLPEVGAFDAIRRCDGVSRIIGHDEVPQAIPDRWVDALRSREERGEFDKTKRRRGFRADGPFPEWVFVGAVVRVMAGPFQGFLAMVVEAVQVGRVKVEVAIFGRATEVDLEVAQIGQM